MRGNLEADIVANALCNSILHVPKECKKLHKAMEKKVKDNLKRNNSEFSDPTLNSAIFVVLLVGAMFLFIMFYFFVQFWGRHESGTHLEDKIELKLNQYRIA